MTDAPLASGCPTALQPAAAREGLLSRICVPGGQLAAAGFARFAQGCSELGIDRFDITNRANLQIRGLSQAQSEAVAALARVCGLLPLEHAGRRRAIVLGPLAGLEEGGAAGAVPLLRLLDAAFLASPELDAVSPKLGVGIETGGAFPIERRSLDLTFQADQTGWRVVLAGHDARLQVSTRDATGVLQALIHLLIRSTAARTKDLLASDGLDRVRRFLMKAADTTEAREPLAARDFAHPPVGLIATGRGDDVVLGAIAAFGALTLQACAGAAEVALAHGGGQIRLTPWRGLVIPGVSRSAAAEAVHELEAAGLSTDPDTAFAVIHACSGVQGCLRADMDVRREASAIAAALGPAARRARHIHVSGCARGCAWPRRADVLLLADGKGAYRLCRDADARTPGDGIEVAGNLPPERAPAAVQALVASLPARAAGQH